MLNKLMTNIAGKVAAGSQGQQLKQLATQNTEQKLVHQASAKMEAAKEMGEKRTQLADRTTGSDKEGITYLLLHTPSQKLIDSGEHLHTFSKFHEAIEGIFGKKNQNKELNRLEQAFNQLKKQFLSNTNKIDREPKTGALQPQNGAKTIVNMLWNDLASNQDKLTAAGLIFHCHKVSQGHLPDFLMHCHKLVKQGIDHPQFYKQIHYLYKRFLERGKAPHEVKVDPNTQMKLQKAYIPYAKDNDMDNTANMIEALIPAVQHTFKSMDKMVEPFESKIDKNPIMVEFTTDFNQGNIFEFKFTASMKNTYYTKIDERMLAKMLAEKGLRKGAIPNYESFGIN